MKLTAVYEVQIKDRRLDKWKNDSYWSTRKEALKRARYFDFSGVYVRVIKSETHHLEDWD